MAKTASEVETTQQGSISKKQIKKQAKREAKLQRKLDQARRTAQKAEKKVNRAQSRLAEAQAQVYTLEKQLAQYRTAKQPLNGTLPADSNTHQPQAEQVPLEVLAVEAGTPTTVNETTTEEAQEVLPPAEEHVDAPPEQIVAEIRETTEAEGEAAADKEHEGKAVANDEQPVEHAASEEEENAVAQKDEPAPESSNEASDDSAAKEQ